MKLTTLKSRLPTLRTGKAPTLTTSTDRPRGRAWMATRERIQVRDASLCCDCGRLWLAHRDHADHDVPLWKVEAGIEPEPVGGVNGDANLRLRCWECHDVKSRREAAERAALGMPPAR